MVCRAVIGFHGQRISIAGNGIIESAKFLECIAEVAMRFRVIRPNGKRLLIRDDSIVQLAHRSLAHACVRAVSALRLRVRAPLGASLAGRQKAVTTT